MSKRSTRAGSRLPGDAGLVLLPPRLQPLSTEQRTEAIALLSDLLLAVARRAADSRDPASAEGEVRQERLAA